MCSFVYKSCFCKLIICSVYILVIVNNALMCSFLLQHEKVALQFTAYSTVKAMISLCMVGI